MNPRLLTAALMAAGLAATTSTAALAQQQYGQQRNTQQYGQQNDQQQRGNQQSGWESDNQQSNWQGGYRPNQNWQAGDQRSGSQQSGNQWSNQQRGSQQSNWQGRGGMQSDEQMAQDQALARGTLALVQRRLRDNGFYSQAPVDGIWGPETRQALQNFQQSNGLQASGQINLATLDALGVFDSRQMQGGGQWNQARQRSGSSDNMSGSNWRDQSSDRMVSPPNRWQSDAYGFQGRGTIMGSDNPPRVLPDNSVPYERR